MLVGSRKEYALETKLKIIRVDRVQMEEYILWKRFLRRSSSMNNQYVAIDSVDNTGHKYIFVSLQIVEITKGSMGILFLSASIAPPLRNGSNFEEIFVLLESCMSLNPGRYSEY